MSDEHKRILQAIEQSGTVPKMLVRRLMFPGLEDLTFYGVLHFEPGLAEPQCDFFSMSWSEAMDAANRLASIR